MQAKNRTTVHLIWVMVFLMVAAGLAAGGYLYYQNESTRIRATQYEYLHAITTLKINQILTWREDILTDAVRLSQDSRFARAIQDWLTSTGDPDAETYILERLSLTGSDETALTNLVIADTHGEFLLTHGLGLPHLDPQLVEEIDQAVTTREIVLGDLHHCTECQDIELHVVAPILSSEASVSAVLILFVDPNDQLFPLVQSWPTPSRTAENLLVRREGDWVVFLNYLKFYEDAPLKLKFPVTDTDIPAVKAVLGYTGYFEGLDYRKVPVLADIQPVAGTPWFIVGKMDTDEILAELRFRAAVIGIFVFASIFTVAAGMLTVFGIRQRAAYRTLYQNEREKRQAVELFRTTLYSIGDGVITTDPAGRVNQMNPTAEALTGWPEAEARGHDLQEVFNIVNAQTRLPVENPARKVIQTGLIVGLANHTMLISREGAEYQIADSGAPIHDQDNEIDGVVMVFRDVTEDYRLRENLEASEEQYRSLFENMPQGFILGETITDSHGNPIDFIFLQVNQSFSDITHLHTDAIMGRRISEVFPGIDPPLITKFARVGLDRTPIELEKFSLVVNVDYHVRIYSPKPGQIAAIFTDVTARNKAEIEASTRTRELEALYSLSASLRDTLSPDDMLPTVRLEVAKSIACEDASILLLDPGADGVTVSGGLGPLASLRGLRFVFSPAVDYPGNYGLDLDDAADRLRREAGLEPSCSLALAAIHSESRMLGLLVASRCGTGAFNPTEVRLLNVMGEIAGAALRRANLFEQAQTHLRRTQALHTIDLAITGSLDLRTALEVFLEQSQVQLSADALSILVYKPHALSLEFLAGRGFRTRMIESTNLRVADSQAGQAIIQRRTFSLPNLDNGPLNFARSRMVLAEGFKAYYAAPLIARGEVQGVLEIFQRVPAQANHDWLMFLDTLASQAAIAIDSLTSYGKLQRANNHLEMAYDATIAGWSQALDLRDKNTEEHSQRVTHLTIKLASMMGLHGEELTNIRRGALLHDLGKIAIPDAILNKPSALTPDEWVLMRKHPQHAFDMLSRVEILRPAMDIPFCHHEKWDGTGYPRSLEGNKIPLPARIFAVVDVYDALISPRPYRPAWTHEDALDYIRSQAGYHFDPDVVDAFLSMMEPAFSKSTTGELPI